MWPSSIQPFCPILLWRLSALMEYHFFSDPGPRNDHCLAWSLLAKRETSLAFDSRSILLSFDLHEMSLNIDMKIILSVTFSGDTPDLNSKSWTLWLSWWTQWILRRYSTRIPLAHHQFCPSFCIPVLFWTTQIFVPMQCLIEGSRVSYQEYRIWKYVEDLCALKTDDLFITNQRQILHSIDLMFFGHQFFTHVGHLFHCEIFAFLMECWLSE